MITTAEAARRKGVSQRRILALLASGRLKGKPFGPMWMVDEKSLKGLKKLKPGRPRKS